MDAKYLYCKKCKDFPKWIKRKYQTTKPFEEGMKWNGECYDMKSTELDNIKETNFCGKCGTPLQDLRECSPCEKIEARDNGTNVITYRKQITELIELHLEIDGHSITAYDFLDRLGLNFGDYIVTVDGKPQGRNFRIRPEHKVILKRGTNRFSYL